MPTSPLRQATRSRYEGRLLLIDGTPAPTRGGRLAGLKLLLRPRPGERLLPAVSAVLLALSFPPLHPLILPFVGLVPMAVWVHGLPSGGEGRRAAVRGSMVFGVTWVWELLHRILPIPAPFLTRHEVLKVTTSHYSRIDKAKRDFGWEPHVGVEESTQRCVEYCRELLSSCS